MAAIRFEFSGAPDRALSVQDLLADVPEATVSFEDPSDGRSQVTGGEVALVAVISYSVPVLAAHVTDLVYRIRQRFRPLAVLDLTGNEPRLTVIEDAPGHAGELVIKTRSGDDAKLFDGPEVPRTELLSMIEKHLQ